MNYLLGIDLGSSGCKTILVNESGNVVSNHSVGFRAYSPYTGWSEQDPYDWWNATVKCVVVAMEKSKINANNIVAIGLSGQMHGLVALDVNGKILRNAILWNDQRSNIECKEIIEKAGGLEYLLKYTNNNILPGYTVSKLIWLRKNEPEIYCGINKILNPKDFIRYCLTKECATDVSDASGTGLFDVNKRTWSEELLKILDIPIEILPKSYESCEMTGGLTEGAANILGLIKDIPVVAGSGNAVAQATGMGLVENRDVGISFGTSGRVSIITNKIIVNTTDKLQMFCGNEKDLWVCMGVSLAAMSSYNWFVKNLCKWEESISLARNIDFYQYLDDYALQSPPGSKNLIFIPYLMGERCPHTDTYAKGAFIGLTNKHRHCDLLRAVIEGVVYNLKQILETILLMDNTFACNEIYLSGGEELTDVWYQIISDVFQLPVKKLNTEKIASAYGAAILAGVGCKILNNVRDARKYIKLEKEFLPDKSSKPIYEGLYKIYKSLYPILKETNIELHLL